MRERMRHVVLPAGLALLAVLAGCSTETRIQGADAALAPDDGSPGFLDRVASQATVPENDALRGVLMLLDGDDKAKTFQQRIDALAAKGVTPADWTYDASRPVTKGRLAYMICRACEVGGGVMMHLTGPSQRYCLRELQYLRMMSPGSVFAEITGSEYVAVLSRADTYRRTGQVPDIMKVTRGGM